MSFAFSSVRLSAERPLIACFFVLLSVFFSPASAQAVEPPSNVYALVYSSSAIELFFTPTAGNTVEITRNGNSFGLTDARSRFEPSLDPSILYRYELRSVSADGQKSSAMFIDANTANFQLPIRRIDAVAEVEATPPPDSVQPQSEDEPMATATPDILPERPDACNVSSIGELRSCINSASAGGTVFVRQNLQCSGGDCCTNGQALVGLNHARDVIVLGNGKRLLRSSSQRQCSLVEVSNSSNITFDQWHLDDDVSVSPCQVGDNCPRMIHIRNSSTITFNASSISHGKGYTVYVNNVDGFSFRNSALINSGVLGMYLGHNNTPSRNITIADSVFRDNQTNALALLGVVGSTESNRISNNLFFRNHRLGQWQVEPQYGSGYTGGGQVYIAKASGVTIENNRIADGYCSNCFIQDRARSGVSGLELGEPRQSSLSNLTIRGNTIMNNDGPGIYANVGTAVPSSILVQNNRLINNVQGMQNIGSSNRSGNQSIDTQHFESFEGDSFYAGYELQTCGSASIERVCGDGQANFGQCRIELSADDAGCGANSATLLGPRMSVQSFQELHANAWIAGHSGNWCFEFQNSGGAVVDRMCRSFDAADRSSVLRFVGSPALSAVAPEGSASVRLVIQTEGVGTRLAIDDIQLGGF